MPLHGGLDSGDCGVMVVAVDDVPSTDSNRPSSVLGRVASFTLSDRLKNVIRQKQRSSCSDGSAATATTSAATTSGCQRCVQVSSAYS